MSEKALPIAEQAAKVITQSTGLIAAYEPQSHHKGVVNERGRLTLKTRRSDTTLAFSAQVAPRLKAWQIDELSLAPESAGEGACLLISDYLPPKHQAKLIAMEANFMDAVGNCHIDTEGFFVHQTGYKPTPIADKSNARGLEFAGIKLVLACLKNPELINQTYRDISQATGIALGAVGKTLSTLARPGYIYHLDQADKRKLCMPKDLLDRWAIEFADRIKPKLLYGKFISHDLNWFKHLAFDDHRFLHGGEVAAEKLTNYLRPQDATVYVQKEHLSHFLFHAQLRRMQVGEDSVFNLGNIVEVYLAPEPKGLIEHPERPDLVHPMIIYADLMGTTDPRNHETARHLYKEHLAHLVDL